MVSLHSSAGAGHLTNYTLPTI